MARIGIVEIGSRSDEDKAVKMIELVSFEI